MTEAGAETTCEGARRPPSLPVGAVVLLYLVACLAPLALAATRTVVPTIGWEVAAAGLGMVGLAAMAVQFVTSGRFRSSPAASASTASWRSTRPAAWWVLLALLLHPVVYVVPTFVADPALGLERLWAYHRLPHYRSGVIALSVLVLLVVGSAVRTRLPIRYETWRAAHVILAALAVGAGLHHAVTAGSLQRRGVPARLLVGGRRGHHRRGRHPLRLALGAPAPETMAACLGHETGGSHVGDRHPGRGRHIPPRLPRRAVRLDDRGCAPISALRPSLLDCRQPAAPRPEPYRQGGGRLHQQHRRARTRHNDRRRRPLWQFHAGGAR